MDNRLSLGIGLLAGAAGVALLMLAWLATTAENAGGFILGLLLLLVVAGPLAGGGLYLLASRRGAAREEAAFASRRQVLERDRLFRRDLAAELRQLARRPGLPVARVTDLAEDLERGSYDAPEWYEAVRLAETDLAVLGRYDDLVWERVRALRDASGVEATRLLRDLEAALEQRRNLLLRGRRAPEAAAADLLRSEVERPGLLSQVQVGDALTHHEEDYVVESVASYFAEGRAWHVARLTPSAGGAARWLYVAPGGLTLALLDDLAPVEPGAPSVEVDGVSAPLADHGTATADMATATAGEARGQLVSYWTYRAGDLLAQVERWPDGSLLARGGRVVRPTDLEHWPAARPATDAAD